MPRMMLQHSVQLKSRGVEVSSQTKLLQSASQNQEQSWRSAELPKDPASS